ncbi:MAG: GNAT family N-acetyltransferase [Betaproteobacteria bacterium]|nr:GNAT family N-acetyltransferase [Betaproteobacteria bacterium]
MHNSISIHRAGTGDLSILLDLMQAFHAESGYPLDRTAAAASFAALFADAGRGAVWRAERAGDAAGYVVLTLRHAMEFDGLAGHIDDLYVAPAHRRNGVATVLLETLRAESRQFGVVALLVEVGRDNAAARRTYGKSGLFDAPGDRVLLAGRLA